ncbi:HAD family acid phosphatase [Edaphobacter sp. 12200R-103]|uniref:HAD family acid phosphatase n=1 Tax=Edaphobacter sp. 12200R-103 TaxID=2703788 RepID=UPI00138C1F8B|nr:HAD family acid phosphatase [Edaphobacter sp. 12200R-103]QHS51122.1 acid phosphatase [Edaphobacter sp. 12200R-103]
MRTRPGFLAMALLTQMMLAQGPPGPPACPVEPGGRPVTLTPAHRPTAQQIRETAEKAAADSSVLVSAEPVPNFGVERYRLADYAECVGDDGCYWADLEAQTRRAEAVLDRAVASRKPNERLAAVLDIDETSLSGFCELRREDYGFFLTQMNHWMTTPEAAAPISGTLRLFNKARSEGVDVFFITGRWDELREATAHNLELAGFKGWKGLALRKGAQKQMTTVAYKSRERQKIVDAGYRIVLNMGDQWSDLNGEARGETSVKLPNPFYYLP